jgi:hypothetical protein
MMGQDSSVGVATRLQAERARNHGKESFLFFTASRPPASTLIGTRAIFLRVRWPGHAADHSPPSTAEVKDAYGATSPLPHPS